jgi:hypothetical protein
VEKQPKNVAPYKSFTPLRRKETLIFLCCNVKGQPSMMCATVAIAALLQAATWQGPVRAALDAYEAQHSLLGPALASGFAVAIASPVSFTNWALGSRHYLSSIRPPQ